MDDAVPTNVVDRELQGWWRGADGLYRTGGSDEPLPIERVMSRWAPLRTLGPAPEADVRAAQESLLIAGKHGAASVAAAAALVVAELERGFAARRIPDPHERAVHALTAGDPASDRAALLTAAVEIGRRVSDIPSAVCAYTRDVIADIVLEWIRGTGPFVDVAGALTRIVSGIADSHGPDGWQYVADDWLQPETRSHDAAVCHSLLYSASRYYTPAP